MTIWRGNNLLLVADGSIAFALLNSADEEQAVELSLSTLGMRGKWRVRDCWRQCEEGVFEGRYVMSVLGHATHLIRLTPVGDAGLKPCLKDIRDNAWRRPFDLDRKTRRARSARPCPDC